MKVSVRLTFICVICSCILSLTACTKNELDEFCKTPSTEPINAIFKTGIPLAHVALMAMSVMSGENVPPLDNFSTTSDTPYPYTYPCLASMTFTLNEDNIPVQFPYYGQVLVAGHWPTENKAVLIVIFIDMEIGTYWNAVEKISTFPVMKNDTGIMIVFFSGDINIQTDPSDPNELSYEEIQTEIDRLNSEPPSDTKVAVEMDTWFVELQDGDTVTDFSDDTYVISGGSQYIDVSSSSAGILQLGLVLATMTPDCNLNPTSGLGVIQEVEVSGGGDPDPPILGQATLHFHSTCDKKVRIGAVTGNYICSVGKKIELNLRDN